MRPSARIENFLEKVDWSKLQKKWKIPALEINTEDLKKYWHSRPDQRIGQILINLGLVEDSMEKWCTEEYQILIGQGVPPEECVYWTSVFDKDGEKLDAPITRRICDLNKGHAKNILIWIKKHNIYISPELTKALKNKVKQDKTK